MEPSEYQKKASEYFSHPDDKEVIGRAFQCILNGESTTYQARMRAGGSEFTWCKIDVTAIIENNVPVKMIGVITDISDIKTKTDRLENAAKLDNFTGLYNKSYSLDLIQKILRRNAVQSHALILLDIDNFKSINDTLGHYTGDNTIKLVADTLKNNFRKTDVIGRFGGDEFILLVQNIPNLDWLTQKLRKLIRCEGHGLSCTNSIGASIFPQDATEFELLFKKLIKRCINQSPSRKDIRSLPAVNCGNRACLKTDSSSPVGVNRTVESKAKHPRTGVLSAFGAHCGAALLSCSWAGRGSRAAQWGGLK